MKSILLSIKPEWVAKILNGEKTIEIRKKFPKDYVGWVYIYCSKSLPNIYHLSFGRFATMTNYDLEGTNLKGKEINGKVVARFWCDKVDGILCNMPSQWIGEDYNDDDATFAFESKNECMSIEQLAELGCIEDDEKLYFYLNADKVNYGTQKLVGYAIHISKLEVFDKPRELWEFVLYDKNHLSIGNCIIGFGNGSCKRLTNAPQNYCYIESEK